ncbi:hypothetical protein RB653_009580 [Dictyostelium firmibasis]|uniref:Rho-GAP domain-containing protein n=1 Tax=Dictyostelium firmibasis TaxID=79012 RepID=A0AAN7YXH7_9MYCE
MSNPSKLSISPPNTFQHVGGSSLHVNKPPALQSPPKSPVLQHSIPQPNLLAKSTSSSNIAGIANSTQTTSSPPSSSSSSSSSNNIGSTLTKSTSNSNLNLNHYSGNSQFGGVLHSNVATPPPPPLSSSSSSSSSSIQYNTLPLPNKILHHPSPKKTTKSTIISGKLKRFFKSRPSRDSLYEKHILSAPFSSATLSFINIFKIITALKKSNAIENEGLFRVNGNAESVRSLWLMLNNVQEAIPVDGNSSPHDLAGLLKLYLRESKFPLVPLELFTTPAVPATIDEAREFVEEKLPTENVRVLSYLIEYLEQVALKSSINKMNPIGLGVCFAPNILRSINTNPSNPQFQVHMTNIQSHCNFITLLIENRLKIFKDLALPPIVQGSNDDETLENLIIQSPPDDDLLDEQDLIESSHIDSVDTNGNSNNNNSGSDTDIQTNQTNATNDNALYDEFINLLTDDSLGASQKSVIIQRMTTLFQTDGDRFKSFLRDMQIDGIISLLEYILTLDEN